MKNKKLLALLAVVVVLGGVVAFGTLSSEDSQGRARRAFRRAPVQSNQPSSPFQVVPGAGGSSSSGGSGGDNSQAVMNFDPAEVQASIVANPSGIGGSFSLGGPSSNAPYFTSIQNHSDSSLPNCPIALRPLGQWKLTSNAPVKLQSLGFTAQVSGYNAVNQLKLFVGSIPGGNDIASVLNKPAGSHNVSFNSADTAGPNLFTAPAGDTYITLYGNYAVGVDAPQVIHSGNTYMSASMSGSFVVGTNAQGQDIEVPFGGGNIDFSEAIGSANQFHNYVQKNNLQHGCVVN